MHSCCRIPPIYIFHYHQRINPHQLTLLLLHLSLLPDSDDEADTVAPAVVVPVIFVIVLTIWLLRLFIRPKRRDGPRMDPSSTEMGGTNIQYIPHRPPGSDPPPIPTFPGHPPINNSLYSPPHSDPPVPHSAYPIPPMPPTVTVSAGTEKYPTIAPGGQGSAGTSSSQYPQYPPLSSKDAPELPRNAVDGVPVSTPYYTPPGAHYSAPPKDPSQDVYDPDNGDTTCIICMEAPRECGLLVSGTSASKRLSFLFLTCCFLAQCSLLSHTPQHSTLLLCNLTHFLPLAFILIHAARSVCPFLPVPKLRGSVPNWITM